MCTAIGDAGLPTFQVRPRRSNTRQAITKDFSKKWKDLVTTCSPAGPANHSQLSVQEEGALVSEKLEKKQKECEQTYCQAWADTALASPKRPELQDQGCCGGAPWSHRTERPSSDLPS